MKIKYLFLLYFFSISIDITFSQEIVKIGEVMFGQKADQIKIVEPNLSLQYSGFRIYK